MKSSPSARLRGVVIVAVTLLIVLAELGFLTAVYHFDDDVEQQHEAYVRVEATLEAWQPGDDTAPLQAAVNALARSGADGSARLQELSRSWASAKTRPAWPGSAQPWTRSALGSLGANVRQTCGPH